jgi:hypothetical protein
MGPIETGLHPGVDGAVDQVKRKLAFEAAHRQWRITWDQDYRVWRA